MWKTRADLPGLIKLDIKYDIDKLREEFKLLDHDQWNADISDSLENMRQENNRLTKKVFGWETGGAENMIKEYRYSFSPMNTSLTHFLHLFLFYLCLTYTPMP